MTPGVRQLAATAEAHAARREWEAAIEAFRAWHALEPRNPHVLLQLSYVASLAGHYRAAQAWALQADALQPTAPGDLAELASRLRTFNAGERLLACLARIGPPARMSIPLLLAFAAQLTYLNLPERAVVLVDEAIRGDPDYPPALLSRAQILMYLGRFSDADADLQRVLRRAPGIAQLWWLLAQVGPPAQAAQRVPRIRALLASAGRPADIATLAFALHRELDTLGDHAGAWQALEQGCAAKRATLDYDIAAGDALFDALHAAWARWPAPALPEAAAPWRPIFIVGMHRSGTTLLETLLDKHPAIHGLGELYDVTSALRHATDHHCKGVIDLALVRRLTDADVDVAAAGARYREGLRWRVPPDALAAIDKLPSNFLHAGAIARALPEARLLHMRRDPVETCFSNLRELFSDANPYSYDQRELAHWQRRHDRLMAASFPVLEGRIHRVDYADLVADPQAAVAAAAVFCGLSYDAAWLDRQSARGVVTASAVQVRSPVARADAPKWRPYERWLGPLIDALARD